MEELTDVSVGNATIIKASPINAQRMNLATSSYAFFIWHLSWLTAISGLVPPNKKSEVNT